MSGSALTGILPQALAELYLGRRTGRLHLTRGEERVTIHWQEGRIVGVDTRARERRPLPFPEPNDSATLKLSRVLQELGIEGRGATAWGSVSIDRRERLLHALSWSDATYTFEESDESEDEDPSLKLSTEEVILEAIRHVAEPAAIRAALGDLDQALCLPLDLSNPHERTLTPTEGFILSRIDGRLSAREVLQLLPLEADDGERGLLGLLLTGRLECLPPPGPAAWRREPPPSTNGASKLASPETGEAASPEADEPETGPSEPPPTEAELPPLDEATAALRREILEAYEALPGKNHFELLGLQAGATDSDVRERYVSLVKRFHPDTHADPRLADLRDVIEAVFIRVGEAYEVLGSTVSRAAYEAALARRRPKEPPAAVSRGAPPPSPSPEDDAHAAWLLAEEIQRAEHLLHQAKYWDAIQILEGTLPRVTNRKKKQRARVLLALAYIKNPNWVRRGEELLQVVVQEDPGNADAYFVLGTIYKGRGLHSRATSMFRKALELKPDHAAAAAELAAPPPPLLRRLFGRH